MSKPATFAAIDLGAESGRVILGTVSDRKLELADLHRFANWVVDFTSFNTITLAL